MTTYRKLDHVRNLEELRAELLHEQYHHLASDLIPGDHDDTTAAPIDWTSLPTFGGEEPGDTEGIWSWDTDRLLVGRGGQLRIVPRTDPNRREG